MYNALTTSSAAANDECGFGYATLSTTTLAVAHARSSSAPALIAEDRHVGRVRLDNALLRHLRQLRLQSQQDLADDCWRRNIRVSIATIKRAESGHAVRYRIAHELARCFDVPVMQIVRIGSSANGQRH